MASLLYAKHLLLRTPFEGVARRVQGLTGLRRRVLHPELRAIAVEPSLIEQVMERVVKPDSNCIDVGCHIGSTLSHILKLAPRGHHIAFEPVPQKAQWLRRKFPEVDVHQAAVADNDVNIPFVENETRPGFSGFGTGGNRASDRTREIKVPCKRLDDLALSSRIDLLKIDVEGAELLVLRGAKQLIARDRPTIIFESAPGKAAKLGLTDRSLFQFLTLVLEYRVYFLRDFLDGGAPTDFEAFEAAHVYPFKAYNYVAVPPK